MKPGRPLAGRRVVITRATDQTGDLAARLRVLGAEPVEVATIAIADPADGGAGLRAAVRSAPDWIVVTSANGARRVLDALEDAEPPRFAVVGPMTASVLERAGVTPALIPPRFVAESLVDAFPAGPGRVVVAQASSARDVVASGIRDKGWEVIAVEAYATVPVSPAQRTESPPPSPRTRSSSPPRPPCARSSTRRVSRPSRRWWCASAPSRQRRR